MTINLSPLRERHQKMKTNNPIELSILFLVTVSLTTTLSACSKQNWYQGMQSAHEARCMQEPVSEYDECMRQSGDSYNEYEKNRGDLSGDAVIRSQ
jgi:hypothetical protein